MRRAAIAQFSSVTNGILGPWAVRQISGTNTSGDYLTLSGTSGPYSLATASYSSTVLSSSSGNSVISLTGSSPIS